MVANVGPADWNYDETLSTLRYANRAKNIKNKPKINEDPKDAMLREYQQEIARLKNALAQREPGSGTAMATLTEEEMSKMRQEIEDQLKSSLSLTGTIQLSRTQIIQVCAVAPDAATVFPTQLCNTYANNSNDFGTAFTKQAAKCSVSCGKPACRLKRKQNSKPKTKNASWRKKLKQQQQRRIGYSVKQKYKQVRSSHTFRSLVVKSTLVVRRILRIFRGPGIKASRGCTFEERAA